MNIRSLVAVCILAAAEPALCQLAPPAGPPAGGSPPGAAAQKEPSSLKIASDRQEQMGEGRFAFNGNVRITYGNLTIQADRVEVDKNRRSVTAEGNVLVATAKMHLSGERAEIDLDSKTGSVFDGYAILDPGIIIEGERIDKVSDDSFVLYQGRITACDQSVPQWSLKASEAKVRIEGYARLRNARFLVKKVPLFWSPYLIVPVKTERSTGLLFPHFGASQSRGSLISEAFYLVLGKSADVTFFGDYYSKSGFAPGLEVRYAPTEGTKGQVSGYYLNDRRDSSVNYRYTVDHQQRFSRTFRFVATANVVKDEAYFQDLERTLSNFSNRTSFWSGYLTGNFSVYSLNVKAENRENFFTFLSTNSATGDIITTNDTVATGKLPEVEFKRRQAKLFGPLDLAFDLSTARFTKTITSTDYDADYTRADLYPKLSMSMAPFPWLTITPRLSGRYTRWSQSLQLTPVDPADPTKGSIDKPVDTPVTRSYGEAEIELVGPRFAKIFEDEDGTKKAKHLIEPEVSYHYISSIDEIDQIPVADSGDYILPLNQLKYGIVTRYYVKRRWKDEEDPLRPPQKYHYIYDSDCNCYQKTSESPSGQEQVFEAPPDTEAKIHELFNVSLFQRYSLDPDLFTDYGRRFNYQGSVFLPNEAESQLSPVTLETNIFPTKLSSITANFDYDTSESRLIRAQLSASYRDRQNRWAELSYIENADFLQRQLRTSIGWHFLDNRWRIEMDHYYDLQNSLGETGLRQQRYLVNYNAQCVGIIVEYSRFSFTGFDDYEVRVALTLPNIGTLVDLRQGASGLYQGNQFGGNRGTRF